MNSTFGALSTHEHILKSDLSIHCKVKKKFGATEVVKGSSAPVQQRYTHIACLHASVCSSHVTLTTCCRSSFRLPSELRANTPTQEQKGQQREDTETSPSEQHPLSTYSHPSGCKFGPLALTWRRGLKCVSSALRECSDCVEPRGPFLTLITHLALDLTLNQLDSGRCPKINFEWPTDDINCFILQVQTILCGS